MSATLDERLRALLMDGGFDYMEPATLDLLRAAARIGAECAFEEAADLAYKVGGYDDPIHLKLRALVSKRGG